MNITEMPQVMRASDIAEMTGINIHSVLRAYHAGHLKGRPPRGMTRPVFFRDKDVIDWLFGEGE